MPDVYTCLNEDVNDDNDDDDDDDDDEYDGLSEWEGVLVREALNVVCLRISPIFFASRGKKGVRF